MGRIDVQIHEGANVLSTMLLSVTGGPKDAKLHPIATHALAHMQPFSDHPSLKWIREFYRPQDLPLLYGRVAQLAGPLSFAPRSSHVPDYVADYKPERMKELPKRMEAFYRDAKLGAFRRGHVAEYALALADVKDVLETARIEEFLTRLYGPIKYKLIVVPVPTNPWNGGGDAVSTAWEAFAFLFPPQVPPRSADPVAWSFNPEATQVLVQHELSHPLHREVMRQHGDLVPRLRPFLDAIPADAPLLRSYPEPDRQFAELFIRGSSVSYLRRTRGDEPAGRWMEGQVRRLGTPLVRDFFLAIEQFLEGARWGTLASFLDSLPKVLTS